VVARWMDSGGGAQGEVVQGSSYPSVPGRQAVARRLGKRVLSLSRCCFTRRGLTCGTSPGSPPYESAKRASAVKVFSSSSMRPRRSLQCSHFFSGARAFSSRRARA
jgi:hypothetical protein